MTTSAREQTTRLVDLLRREHSAMADFLLALAELDSKRLWERLGYPSLFSFLRRELRLSAGAAQYRKTAAELVQRFPPVEAALRDGQLCLSSVIELAKVVTPENVAEVLPRFFGLSARDAAFVVAEIRPVENPPVRDFVVTSLRIEGADTTPFRSGAEVAVELRTSELPLASAPPPTAPFRPPDFRDRPVVRPIDAERARVNMTVPRRLLEKLAAARDALSHSHPGASEDQILEVGLDLIIQRHAKRRGLVEKPRIPKRNAFDAASAPPAAPGPRGREPIPASIKRAVWLRDGGRCQWPVEGGRVCGSTVRVQLDHVVPVALGGTSTEANLRCLCGFHNDRAAREVFGDEHMDRFTDGGRQRRPARS